MSSVSLTDQQQVIKKLLDYIRTMPDLPESIELETFPKSKTGLMLQQLAGAVKTDETIAGDYTALYPFAIYCRVNANDTISRVKATGGIINIGRWMEQQTVEKTLPTLGENRTATAIEMRSFPAMVTKTDAGEETYQATFVLTYEQKQIA